jgi:hypothetical protein
MTRHLVLFVAILVFLSGMLRPSFAATKGAFANEMIWVGKDLTGVASITATTGTFTTGAYTNLNIGDDLVVTDDLTVNSTINADHIVVTGGSEGTIDNVVIGGSTAKAGTFTTLIGTAGTINGITVGASTAAAGTFTNLTANGNFTATGGTIDSIPIGQSTSSTGMFLYLTSAGMTLSATLSGGVDATLNDITMLGDMTGLVDLTITGNLTAVDGIFSGDVSSTGDMSGASSAFTTAVFTNVPNGFSVIGTVTATAFSGDGTLLTGLPAGSQVVDGGAHVTANDGVSVIIDVADDSNEITILASGAVGINNPNPTVLLDVNGDTRFVGDSTVTGDLTVSQQITASQTISSTTLITASTGTFSFLNGNGTGIGGVVHTATNETVNGTKTFSDADIDGGAIDGTPIGQTSASNAIFGIVTATTANMTTINATTINGTINTATQATITDIGTQTSADINGGFIDGTPIGQTSASNAVFGIVTATTANLTTINATTINGTIGTASQLNITAVGSMTRVTATNGDFTNVNGTLQTAAQPNVTSLGTLSGIDVNGGFIDGTPIGQTSASNAIFGIVTATTANLTTINATTINGTINTATQGTITDIGTQTSADIDGGFIDGTPIGQTSASNAVFGIVTATTANLTTINATTINGTIATATQASITDIGTQASVDIDGGFIDGTPIGQTSASDGKFGTVTAATRIVSGSGGADTLILDDEIIARAGINNGDGSCTPISGDDCHLLHFHTAGSFGYQRLTAVAADSDVLFWFYPESGGNARTFRIYKQNGQSTGEEIGVDLDAETGNIDLFAYGESAGLTIESTTHDVFIDLKADSDGDNDQWRIQVDGTNDALLFGDDTTADHSFGPTYATIAGTNPNGYTFHVSGTTHSTGNISSDGNIISNGVTLPLPSYGSLAIADDSITVYTISTAGHYQTTTTWEVSYEKSGFLTDSQGNTGYSTNPSDGLLVDTNGAGVYDVHLEATISGPNIAEVKVYAHKNGTIDPYCGLKATLNASGSPNRGAATCKMTLVAGDFVDVRVTSDGGGDAITLSPAGFNLTRIDN